jgi:ATP-dependent Clp protease ATP-binding subunit ClpC
MTSGFFPGGYDDLFGRYAGGGPRQPRRIDITQLLTERARDLVNAAARRAAETGSPDLDTDHLLWAMTEDETIRSLLSRAGAEPCSCARCWRSCRGAANRTSSRRR